MKYVYTTYRCDTTMALEVKPSFKMQLLCRRFLEKKEHQEDTYVTVLCNAGASYRVIYFASYILCDIMIGCSILVAYEFAHCPTLITKYQNL